MLFRSLYELWIADTSKHLKQNSIDIKKAICRLKILPFLGDIRVSEISPIIIRNWQNEIIAQGLTGNYLRATEVQFSLIMKFGAKYHNVKNQSIENMGKLGKRTSHEMGILTIEEFNLLIDRLMKDNIRRLSKYSNYQYAVLFNVLFWTGARIGEVLALTWNDIDLENKNLKINKTRYHTSVGYTTTTPKTEGSNRTVSITENLVEILKKYKSKILEKEHDLVFTMTTTGIRKILETYLEACNLRFYNI